MINTLFNNKTNFVVKTVLGKLQMLPHAFKNSFLICKRTNKNYGCYLNTTITTPFKTFVFEKQINDLFGIEKRLEDQLSNFKLLPVSKEYAKSTTAGSIISIFNLKLNAAYITKCGKIIFDCNECIIIAINV